MAKAKSASNSCSRLRLASAVVFLSETLGQPSAGRHLCSKLMFQLYSVPGLAYGVDCLHST